MSPVLRLGPGRPDLGGVAASRRVSASPRFTGSRDTAALGRPPARPAGGGTLAAFPAGAGRIRRPSGRDRGRPGARAFSPAAPRRAPPGGSGPAWNRPRADRACPQRAAVASAGVSPVPPPAPPGRAPLPVVGVETTSPRAPGYESPRRVPSRRAQPADLARAQADDPQRLDEGLRLAGGGSLHVGLGDHRHRGLLRPSARLQPPREGAPADALFVPSRRERPGPQSSR
jgi:hypothetical protein